jgi:hypothetical protein
MLQILDHLPVHSGLAVVFNNASKYFCLLVPRLQQLNDDKVEANLNSSREGLHAEA